MNKRANDARVEAMARAIEAELFFQQHGLMPASGWDMPATWRARAAAEVALLVADGDLTALEDLRRTRDGELDRWLAPAA